MTPRDAVVVGGGHNGLVAACYLARAGLDVVVLEALDRPGGGSKTEETIPGYRFDTHSVAHNIINMTSIPAELDLAGAGLVYREMDPFSVAVHADGRRVRFYRSIEDTVDSIAESSPAEARDYARFLRTAVPVVQSVLPAVQGRMTLREVPRRLAAVVAALHRHPVSTLRDAIGPYDALLRRRLRSDLTRGPVAAFAAHAAMGPSEAGGAIFAWWQAAYHLFGQWHAVGGAQGLTDALVARLASLGGELRTGARVARIVAPGGRVAAVITETGERIDARAVVTAVDPQVALLELLDPPLGGAAGDQLAAARRGNVVQAVVHVAVDRLPPYPGCRAGDWNGLQSFVDRLDGLCSAWAAAEAGDLPEVLPLYAFTTSAVDPALAPPGHHTVYLACPATPARVRGGWAARREEFVAGALQAMEARAPGFRSSIKGVAVRTPEDVEREEGWPGAHPMHLDLALDQIGPFRPTRRLGRHRTPVGGLYVSGAGTNPTGGIAGTPGRRAAEAVLADRT